MPARVQKDFLQRLVLPDGFYTTLKVLVTRGEQDIIQRLDEKETSDVTPQLAFR